MDAFDVNASSYNTNDGEVSFGSDGGHGGGNRYILDHTVDGTHHFYISDTMSDTEPENFDHFTLDFTSNTLTKSVFIGNIYSINDNFDVTYFTADGSDDGVVTYVRFTGDTAVDSGGTFLMTVEGNPVGESFTMPGSYYQDDTTANFHFGGDTGGGTGPTPPSGPEYTHIGNSTGGTSGVDTSTSNYDASTGVVEFFQGVDPSSSIEFLVVNNDSLYVDNGNDDTGASDQTMGVYLDMGLGLASALVPSENTVTTPEAGEIILPGNGPQPSDISIENIVFDGDNVSFDIYVNEIPSTITGWSSIVFRGNLNGEFITSPGLDSGAEFVTPSDEFSDIYASPQIWLYDDYLSIKPSGGFDPVNFTGKVASFSGPAGLFGSMADDGTNTTTWNLWDLLYNSDSGLENNFGFFPDSVQFYQDAFVYPYMDDLLTLNAFEDDGSTRLALDGTERC